MTHFFSITLFRRSRMGWVVFGVQRCESLALDTSIHRKDMSTAGRIPADSSAPIDTWDQPEFDDDAGSTKRKTVDGKGDEDAPSKRSKASSVKLIVKDVNESTELSETAPDTAGLSPATRSNESEREASEEQPRKRRSFCNFHYMTTQGGSSTVEPGDDPSMQSPSTEAKATVTLLEFSHDEHAPPKLPE